MRRLEQQRDEALARSEETLRETRALAAQIHLLQTSTSWRITAPLRRFVTGLRRVAGRRGGETTSAALAPSPAPIEQPVVDRSPRPANNSRQGKTILILDHSVPKPDQDAGSRAIMDFMLCLFDAGWHICFWPQDRRQDETYTAALEHLGVEVIDHRWPGSIGEWLRHEAAGPDRILISRATVAEALVMQVIAESAAPLVYYGHDIAFARLEMEAAIRENPARLHEIATTRAFERRLWRLFDKVIYLSEEEVATVRALEPTADARRIVPFFFDTFIDRPSAPRSKTILFVAGFAHAPNADAAEFLVYQVLPLVQAQCQRSGWRWWGRIRPGRSRRSPARRST